MKHDPKFNIPTVFVIYGATGDLMRKKVVPALFHLHIKGKLPLLLQIIGFAKSSLSKDAFRTHVKGILEEKNLLKGNTKEVDSFLNLFSYHQGTFEKEADYKNLAKTLGQIDGEWKVCSNKLFYLAVHPSHYKTIFTHLHSSGLTLPCSPEEGWTRVLVEKPFGKDLETAEDLDLLLAKLFKEEQIFRIDHYLAKEMLQNILTFRFANDIFEEIWNNRFIEQIEIKLLEEVGVEDRGLFYEGLGALRDVGQNHHLQMLALLTMNHPLKFDAESVRAKRAEILQTLRTPSQEEIENFTARAQHEGYKNIPGVNRNSQTETYFKTLAFLDAPRWQGVPIVLESGKRMGRAQKEIIITFRHLQPCLCPPGKTHHKNKIIFQIEPEEKIIINFWSKAPGLGLDTKEGNFDFLYREKHKKVQYTEEYEKLLLDCIVGDQTLFLSTAEVKEMWRYVDPIVRAWEENKVPLLTYKPDSKEISKQVNFQSAHLESGILKAKKIGVVGLGKMGAGIARQLTEKGWQVVGYNDTPAPTKELEKEGIIGAYSLAEMIEKLPSPKVVWVMVPAGEPTDEVILGSKNNPGLAQVLKKGDIIIDGGNSYFKNTIERGEKLKKTGIHFLDVGTSGGPAGARWGACLMVGGKDAKIQEYLMPLFRDLAKKNAVECFSGIGAGHFVKMIHNGIEYGMMQALAEGFNILKKSDYKLDLSKVTEIYNNGSVIESRLTNWLKGAFALHGEALGGVTGTVGHTGEGAWTVKTAKEMGVEAKIIEGALQFRVDSEKNPSYTGKVLSALREQFGGHSIES